MGASGGLWRMVILRTLFVPALACALTLAYAPALACAQEGSAVVPTETPSVLYLSSRQYGWPAVDSLVKGVVGTLVAGGISANDVFVENGYPFHSPAA